VRDQRWVRRGPDAVRDEAARPARRNARVRERARVHF
jgi:hypothetical protein